MAQERKTLPAFVRLTLITLIAGLLLGLTYTLTKDPIAEQTRLSADRARSAVFAQAEFTQLTVPEGAGVDWLYSAYRDGELAGYVLQKTVKGYGGEIEVIVGVDTQMRITGVSAGGANFAETPGLGAKAKDAAFLGQYAGKLAGEERPVRVIRAGDTRAEDTVDAITSATITSRAVNNAVNEAVKYIGTILIPGRAQATPSDAPASGALQAPGADTNE